MTNGEFFESLRAEYALVRVLSQKNGCRVLLLRHRDLGKSLVLRLYETEMPVYSFLKSIEFANLPRVYDAYETDDGQAVLEEYIDGITVTEVLESGAYTSGGMKKVISAVCDALDVIHKNGFVHRDIKPENIMISKDGTVKLIDFNAARVYKKSASGDTEVLGTVGFAAPEQLGIAQSDYRADIYALGVLINVMLTLRHPSELLAPGKAGKVVLKCTSIDPKARYRSALEVKNAL